MPAVKTDTFKRPPLSLRTLPRRFYLLFATIIFFVLFLTLYGPPQTIPTVAEIEDTIKHPKLPIVQVPKLHNPFGQASHKPPVQDNTTSGDARWFSDWKWRNPFSSTITLDENRAVLPPRRRRPPIYTFYDTSVKKDKATIEAENKLILAWRRAWWAQGFRPTVLGRPEAMSNAMYETLQRLNLKNANLETEVARWLAWSHMKGGILANWLTLPMGPIDDPLISFLRRGEYAGLTRYEGLSNGLFCGDKLTIDKTLTAALGDTGKMEKALSMIDAVKDDAFTVDKKHDGIALYDMATISSKYKPIAEKLEGESRAQGLEDLSQLINYHLQTTWHNSFPSGISIIRILPKGHITSLIEPAIELARNLTQCASTPIKASCPPNRPNCKPCSPQKPFPITTIDSFRNDTSSFTIGTVPHPYTMTSLNYMRDALDARFIRREVKDRDPWLHATTKDLLGPNLGGAGRIIPFKDAVASDWAVPRTLWLTAERETHKDLDWIFGFAVPSNTSSPDGRPPMPQMEPPTPNSAEVTQEKTLLAKARDVIRSKVRASVLVTEAVEAWNLADTEAWRFARAWSRVGDVV
ncbi:hypothetical protein M501DRAFT_719998 [Patellaria atrata CBS 101060]|uniref:Uncharacterized protein n=1 Tax=Patellaria atrata CBS 101060 TaxID=1346257 RepID=A0A9P4SBR4_9PEZI|nr:hypothetical protein M501DRAFT_719998 [Patellaria atrata CBS 101060]